MEPSDVITILIVTVEYYMPAMAANGGALFVNRGNPIDKKITMRDGRRVLGDGKTWEGFFVGMTFGTCVGIGISNFLGISWILVGFSSSLGALLGDIMGAFIKRRLGMERGARAPILDQLDFVFGSTVLLYIQSLYTTLFPSIYNIITEIILALLLHVLTNKIAYKMGLKDVPW
jgi:CDP-2,3-bis-(O-geranylgeranyl)-sn-glycerol synthase